MLNNLAKVFSLDCYRIVYLKGVNSMADVIPHWLSKQAELKPNQTAIELEDGSIITFKELCYRSKQYARKLANLGITKDSHVGILSNNHPSTIIAIHALSYLGAVLVLLNTKLTVRELQFQINDAEISTLLYSESLFQKVEHLEVNTCTSFTEVNNYVEKNEQLHTELDLNKPFTIIYTSGTTGFPKGVIHTYGNHWWSAIGSALNLGLSSHDKWLAVLPFFHVSGLSILLKSVIYGMPVYLMEKFDENRFQEAIMEKNVTIASVVTVMLQRLLNNLGNQRYPDSFRCMLLGGGPAPEPVLSQAKKALIPVFQSYGLTETSSQIATLSPHDALRKIGSAGKPLTPAQLEVASQQPHEVGEIHVKGPMVTEGYFKNVKANEASFQNGWMKTGDLGYLDEEGFLYVVDRRSDLIISGGENVYPSEIESFLLEIPGVSEVGVTGKIHDKWGEVPVAFIVKREGHDVSKSDIIDYAKNNFAAYKIPEDIHFVSELPRNASNKLVRQKLKEWL